MLPLWDFPGVFFRALGLTFPTRFSLSFLCQSTTYSTTSSLTARFAHLFIPATGA